MARDDDLGYFGPGSVSWHVHREVTVLFGGQYANDTWEWDGVNWTQRTSAHTPLGRVTSVMAFDAARGKTVLFGGTAMPGGTWTLLNDTWEWDGIDWTQLSPATSPVVRQTAAMTYDANRKLTVLFGGYSPTGYRLADTWEWDGVNWTQRPSTTTPTARWGHTMVYDTVEHVSVVFGGAGDTGEMNDTWAWDGSNWSQVPTATAPPARNYHVMSFDSARGTSVIFGGYLTGVANFSDTWTGAFVAPTPTPTPTPTPVPAPTATARSFQSAEGTAATSTVADFAGGQAPFTAAVNWGDGSSSAGSITGSSVAGTHTYAEEGSYTVSVTVTDARGLSGSGSATATISDAPLLAAGRNVTAERKESSPRLLATFKDADPAGKLGDYAATITWGDGTAAQPGAVASLDGVTFFVSGSHTYASKGTFTATVRIVEGGGYTTTVTSTVTVS